MQQGRQIREIDPTAAEQQAWITRGIKEKEIAEAIGRELMARYPGYNWEVEVELRGGIAAIRNLSLNGMWGFVVHLEKLATDPDDKLIMRAGGEILERYYLHTGARRPGDVESAVRDLRGNAIGDHSGAS